MALYYSYQVPGTKQTYVSFENREKGNAQDEIGFVGRVKHSANRALEHLASWMGEAIETNSAFPWQAFPLCFVSKYPVVACFDSENTM